MNTGKSVQFKKIVDLFSKKDSRECKGGMGENFRLHNNFPIRLAVVGLPKTSCTTFALEKSVKSAIIVMWRNIFCYQIGVFFC